MKNDLLKKALLISAFVAVFILGVLLSELFFRGFNGIFGAGTFDTRAALKQQLAQQEKQAKEQQDQIQQKYDQLSGQMTQKLANMNSLVKEVEGNLNPEVVKDILLTTPADQTGDKGTIFLNAGDGEGFLKTASGQDPTVKAFTDAFNKKAQDIIDVAKGILKDKISQLNGELLRINNELKDRNVQVIGKLKENQKLKKEVDDVNDKLEDSNNKLADRNQQLEGKLKEVEKLKGDVDDVNNTLQERNKQLEANLQEVEKYKKELDDHRRKINDLEGIKTDLEKSVGALETKIEDGRLRVSFKGDILFESGKHELRTEGKALLESVSSILKESVQKNDIFIAGHTDNVPLRTDAQYESNWTLSTYRAIEVVKYLVGKGLSPDKLTAAGYGEFKPIASNDTPEGKTQNRRVELYLIPRIIKR